MNIISIICTILSIFSFTLGAPFSGKEAVEREKTKTFSGGKYASFLPKAGQPKVHSWWGQEESKQQGAWNYSQLVTAQLGSCGLDYGPCSQYNLRFIIVLNKPYIPELYSL